jgi:hypothetical protein
MLLIRVRSVALLVLLVFAVTVAGAQTVTPAVSADALPAHQEGDKLLGGYGPYRAICCTTACMCGWTLTRST